jgi:predicted tellurium resistance membrane protein TerC
MDVLLSFEALGTLASLIFLQAVLGFDNLLYISIESKRAPAEKQAMVRKVGIAIAVVLRLVLLFVVMQILASVVEPLFKLENFAIAGEFNLKALIFLLGGGFIMYTAVKEINHLLSIDDLHHEAGGSQKSTFTVITLIVFMNLIFSFDSILSMLPLTGQFASEAFISPQFILLAIAVVTSGALMILLADRVASFIEKNRMFEVLGLFILLIVGIMLLSEGGHIAHMSLFGYKIEAMAKSTFYFSVAVLFIVDIVQTRFQRKLNLKKKAEIADPATKAPTTEAAYAQVGGTPSA